jgi:excisionase family DNA binding protein
MTPSLLKLRRVREILDVGKGTLSSYIRDGKLRAVRMPGGHQRVAEDDLAAFIESRKSGVHSQSPRA